MNHDTNDAVLEERARCMRDTNAERARRRDMAQRVVFVTIALALLTLWSVSAIEIGASFAEWWVATFEGSR